MREPASSGKALVTGGAGFIGSHLCERLLERGTHVVCLDNFATGRAENVGHLAGHPRFELREADITEPLALDEPVDTVFHLASAASPPDYLRLPVETLEVGSLGTRNVLELAEEHGARMVLASTSEVYGDPLEYPQRETYWGNVNPVGPRSVYDEAKRYAESLTMAHHRARGADVGIARIFNCYGPRMRADDGRMVPTFVTQALEGRHLTVAGDGHQTRSLCYVEDTVRGLLALADSKATGPINIGSDEELSVLSLARIVLNVTGAREGLTFIERAEDDPRFRRPDIRLADEVLNWRPRIRLEEGLRRTVAYFVEQRSRYDDLPEGATPAN
ncbi:MULTISPECIES: NAD-dependent epimerase/dehydratase family protein [Nocardiopsis]|uniref:Epimerase n=1 Tax=Nocardiopsis sinuspersici TaxID=501010 RepID=A0A1V3BYB1_9ACTN|nr:MULTISPECIES: NAD-dependent epimerase/dehydratase family protein [Nocardiopsis]NYH54774.1 dTDP-glucose 4,6-dehydratase [Nocardiopsis sinuspersici]OOC53531.1 epimerase [Nocardiopsis sinuspersici]